MSANETNEAAATEAAPERELVFDMLRRAVPVAPVLVVAGAIGWGWNGALSAGFGVLVVLVNLLLAAGLLAGAAKISSTAIMIAAVGGFGVRMSLVVIALAVVRDLPWVEVIPLGVTIVVTHVGLLVWESRNVSASLAYPALKPRRS